MKKTTIVVIGTIIVAILAYGIQYLCATGVMWVIFKIFAYGGITINFSVWLAGLIFYIIYLMLSPTSK